MLFWKDLLFMLNDSAALSLDLKPPFGNLKHQMSHHLLTLQGFSSLSSYPQWWASKKMNSPCVTDLIIIILYHKHNPFLNQVFCYGLGFLPEDTEYTKHQTTSTKAGSDVTSCCLGQEIKKINKDFQPRTSSHILYVLHILGGGS